MDSVDVDEPQLKGHLLSPEFFDAERHPQLRFSSTALDVADDGSVRLRGELEIRGSKREVEVTGRFAEIGTDLGGNARLGLSLGDGRPRRLRPRLAAPTSPTAARSLDYEVSIAVDLELVVAEAE